MKDRTCQKHAPSCGSRPVLGVLFAAYLAGLCYLLFFEKALGRTDVHRGYSYNLVLLREIRRFVRYREQLGLWPIMVNLVGNVCCFIPFGMFLYLEFPRLRYVAAITAVTCLFSLLIETTQLVFQVGCFDVDDILLNTLGGFFGAVGMVCYNYLGMKGKKHREMGD